MPFIVHLNYVSAPKFSHEMKTSTLHVAQMKKFLQFHENSTKNKENFQLFLAFVWGLMKLEVEIKAAVWRALKKTSFKYFLVHSPQFREISCK